MNELIRHPDANKPLWRRLWIYQSSRFPLLKTAPLLAVFSAASISVSAHLGARPLPGLWPFVIAWLVTLIIFFQMRAADEYKDLDEDRRFRPERPIPSGLVSLKLILGLGLAGSPLALLLATSLNPALALPLILVWVWLFAMSMEFFAPDWLKARPLLYLLSHMIIMPLIDLFITACEWLSFSSTPPQGLWLFLALSFVNGSVIEIGRKVWAPQSERTGVETYSRLLGPKRAAQALMLAVVISYLLLIGVGRTVGAPLIVAGLGALMLAFFAKTVLSFINKPTQAGEKQIDMISGLWVFCCYSLAGFAPYLAKGLS